MKIAVIGLGEVGRCYARAFVDGKIAIEACETHVSPAARQLADAVGINVHPGPGTWMADADIVVSAVTGGAAVDAARAAFPFMARGAIFADFSTASPDEMRTANDEACILGLRFVDVAIMGGITLTGAKTPLLFAGSGADDLATAIAPIGAKTRIMADAQPGDAVMMKLLRSVFMKGLEALSVECLTLAEIVGLKAQLYENLADFDQAPLPDFLDMLVRTHVIHAARRYHEVEAAEVQLVAFGFEPRVTSAVKSLFDRSRKALEGKDVSPDVSVAAALQMLIDSART
jgi:3-hydroxyisobutyrate dehydrogenase